MICSKRTLTTRIALVAGTVFAAAWFLAACSDPDSTAPPEQNAAEIFRPVIADLVDRSPLPDLEADTLLVVFVETIGPAITLETQVALVESFGDLYEVRFIDTRSEAVGVELDDEPVRAESVLIGIGLIRSDDTAEVRGETYRSISDVSGYHYTLNRHPELGWAIAGEPESVEPEWLVVPS